MRSTTATVAWKPLSRHFFSAAWAALSAVSGVSSRTLKVACAFACPRAMHERRKARASLIGRSDSSSDSFLLHEEGEFLVRGVVREERMAGLLGEGLEVLDRAG